MLKDRPAKANPLQDAHAALETAVLTAYDWNFDNVPANELAVCRLWEYARESESIRNIWQKTVSVAFDNTVSKETRNAIRKEFYRFFGALGRASVLFQLGFCNFGGNTSCRGFWSPFPQPWQSLPPEQRRVLVETVTWEFREHFPIPGFRRTGYAYAKATVDGFQPKSLREVFGGDGRVGESEYYHAGNKLRFISPNYMYKGGLEVLAVEIHWGKFTNEQLVEHFAQWLKENEPEGIQRPDRRGHKARDIRVALDRLGMMRLLHHLTLREMPVKCPDAAKTFQGYEWYKERKRAAKTFHELFSFLPKAETPISWPTRGGRSR